MHILNDAPVTRIATLGFAPPPHLNVPTSVFYTDIDNETGERSRVPVTKRTSRRSQDDVFQALLKMMLIELAHELNIDPASPPAWVPEIDDALDANLMLTAGELYERLLDEIVAEEKEQPAGRTHGSGGPPPASPEHAHFLPLLLSEICLVFEEIERRGGLREAFINPTDDARDDLIQQAIKRATSPIRALRDLFDVRMLDFANVKLGSGCISTNEEFESLGEIGDLVVATALAWATNLATSTAEPGEDRIGFWLCDANDKRISKILALDLKLDDGGILFDLNLSATLGRAELEKMNLALEKLVQQFGSNGVTASGHALRQAEPIMNMSYASL
jgi:hypothetical protein